MRMPGCLSTAATSHVLPLLLIGTAGIFYLFSFAYLVANSRNFLLRYTVAAPETYKWGSIVRPASDPRYLSLGWSHPEDWGVWTDASTAALVLKPARPASTDVRLTVKALPHTAPNAPVLRVLVGTNGHMVETWIFHHGEEQHPRQAILPQALVNNSPILLISFAVTDPKSPAELGTSSDQRTLGMGLSEFRLEEVAQ